MKLDNGSLIVLQISHFYASRVFVHHRNIEIIICHDIDYFL